MKWKELYGKYRSLFRFLLLSIVLVTVIIFCFIRWQKQTYDLENNRITEVSDTIYRLSYETIQNGSTVNCAASLEIAPDDAGRYVLVFFRFQNLSILSETGTASLSPGAYQRVKSIPLSDFRYDSESQVLTASWTSDPSYFPGSVYLMLSEVFSYWEQLCTRLSYLTLGFFFLMMLYSIFLFSCKPDEYYLTSYYIYTITLLIIVIFNTRPFGFSLPTSIYSYLQPATTMLHTCIGLLALYNFVEHSKVKRKHSIALVILITLLYTLIMNIVSSSVAEMLRLTILLVISGLLISAAAKKVRCAWLLLVGHSLSLGLVLVQMMVNMGIMQDWFEFTMLRMIAFLEIPFAIVFMFCITQRFADKFRESEQLTRQLSEFNQQLDEKVRLRTLQYRQEQDLRHNMMLNVFHDLRTPIFTVQGCIDILSDKLEDEKELVDVMKHRLSFASELTESLFLQAKLEDNDWIIPFSRFSLEDILGSVCQAMSIEAEKKTLSFDYDIPENIFLWANREQLQRAFQNLIVNSIHYTPEGGSVTVFSGISGENVCIVITDTGKGMSEEDLSHLFTKYYRSNKHMDSYSSGLGLSIAQSIIERHKGRIDVTSTPGTGTSMMVVLPVLS